MRNSHRTPPLWLSLAAVAATLIATVATMQFERKYPTWKFIGDSGFSRYGNIDCQIWVAKSGKTGVGIGGRLSMTGVQEQTVKITSARLLFPGHPVAATKLPGSISIITGAVWRFYLPFPFDNEDLWNRDIRAAVLEIHFLINGRQEFVRRIPMVHTRVAPHGPGDPYQDSLEEGKCVEAIFRE